MRDLTINGNGVGFEHVPAGLHALRIRTEFLSASALEVITTARLPQLTHLELWLGHWPDSVTEAWADGTQYFGGSTSPSNLEALLEGTHVPALRHLALTNCAWQSDLLLAVLESPVLRQLQTLDLCCSFLDSEDVRCILDRGPSLAHLQRLDLSQNQIFDTALCAELEALLGDRVVLADQREHEHRYHNAMSLLAYQGPSQ